MTSAALTFIQTADLYGISEDSLRLYEREGVVVPLRIGDDRYYSTKDRIRIEIILKGRRLGFSLHEIKQLILAHFAGRASPPRDPTQLNDRIAHLERRKLDLQAAIDALRARAETETPMMP